MFETTLPRIFSWRYQWCPTWRLSTWWPSDSRDSMQRSLLRLLSVAHAERLDVTPLVANFAEEHRGDYRNRLRRLALRLADGTPLVDALEQSPDVLSDEAVLAIRFATQTGTLSPTYRYLVENHDATTDRVQSNLRQTFYYSVGTLLILVLSLSFLIVFIVPTIAAVREEFLLNEIGAEAPWAFRVLITACDILADYAPLWILAAVIVAWLVWSLPSRRFFRRFVATRWVRGIAQTRSAEILQLLSQAVEAGRPLPAAISTLARYHFDKSVREKLLFARNEIEQGADVWTSLTESRLLTPQEASALANSSSSRSRVWAMRRLADWKQNTVIRRNENVVALVQPIMTLFFAAIVLLIGTAIFGVLTEMIDVFA